AEFSSIFSIQVAAAGSTAEFGVFKPAVKGDNTHSQISRNVPGALATLPYQADCLNFELMRIRRKTIGSTHYRHVPSEHPSSSSYMSTKTGELHRPFSLVGITK